MIDVHAPDVIATLNRRAWRDRTALQRDLMELARSKSAAFTLLVGAILESPPKAAPAPRLRRARL